jgi:hypothetical protein
MRAMDFVATRMGIYGIYQILSFTLELRPQTIDEGGFVLPPSPIQPPLEFIHRVL